MLGQTIIDSENGRPCKVNDWFRAPKRSISLNWYALMRVKIAHKQSFQFCPHTQEVRSMKHIIIQFGRQHKGTLGVNRYIFFNVGGNLDIIMRNVFLQFQFNVVKTYIYIISSCIKE